MLLGICLVWDSFCISVYGQRFCMLMKPRHLERVMVLTEILLLSLSLRGPDDESDNSESDNICQG